jgi:hypothetical protein
VLPTNSSSPPSPAAPAAPALLPLPSCSGPCCRAWPEGQQGQHRHDRRQAAPGGVRGGGGQQAEGQRGRRVATWAAPGWRGRPPVQQAARRPCPARTLGCAAAEGPAHSSSPSPSLAGGGTSAPVSQLPHEKLALRAAISAWVSPARGEGAGRGLCWAGLRWAGLGCAGLGWAGLGGGGRGGGGGVLRCAGHHRAAPVAGGAALVGPAWALPHP